MIRTKCSCLIVAMRSAVQLLRTARFLVGEDVKELHGRLGHRGQHCDSAASLRRASPVGGYNVELSVPAHRGDRRVGCSLRRRGPGHRRAAVARSTQALPLDRSLCRAPALRLGRVAFRRPEGRPCHVHGQVVRCVRRPRPNRPAHRGRDAGAWSMFSCFRSDARRRYCSRCRSRSCSSSQPGPRSPRCKADTSPMAWNGRSHSSSRTRPRR